MTCFTPLKGYKDVRRNGKLTFEKVGPRMEVACGQCIGCRVDHALMWAVRIVHESYLWMDENGNSWVTLTYRDPWECTPEQYGRGWYIPEDYSLRPDDVSKFIRRLRKSVSYKIRYFYCGEYGEENQRPHYHVCLFNHSFDDIRVYRDTEGIITYTSESLERLWPFGFATVQELNYHNAAYTARYSLKKVTGDRAEEHYLRCDEYGVAFWLLPEYIRMSRGRGKPSGIGAGFYERFKDEIFPADETPVPGVGVVRRVPRYYSDILKSTDPDVLSDIRLLRQEFKRAHARDYTPERLEQRHKCAKARLKPRRI
mgnify:CR=1 FL=1